MGCSLQRLAEVKIRNIIDSEGVFNLDENQVALIETRHIRFACKL